MKLHMIYKFKPEDLIEIGIDDPSDEYQEELECSRDCAPEPYSDAIARGHMSPAAFQEYLDSQDRGDRFDARSEPEMTLEKEDHEFAELVAKKVTASIIEFFSKEQK